MSKDAENSDTDPSLRDGRFLWLGRESESRLFHFFRTKGDLRELEQVDLVCELLFAFVDFYQAGIKYGKGAVKPFNVAEKKLAEIRPRCNERQIENVDYLDMKNQKLTWESCSFQKIARR